MVSGQSGCRRSWQKTQNSALTVETMRAMDRGSFGTCPSVSIIFDILLCRTHDDTGQANCKVCGGHSPRCLRGK